MPSRVKCTMAFGFPATTISTARRSGIGLALIGDRDLSSKVRAEFGHADAGDADVLDAGLRVLDDVDGAAASVRKAIVERAVDVNLEAPRRGRRDSQRLRLVVVRRARAERRQSARCDADLRHAAHV